MEYRAGAVSSEEARWGENGGGGERGRNDERYSEMAVNSRSPVGGAAVLSTNHVLNTEY